MYISSSSPGSQLQLTSPGSSCLNASVEVMDSPVKRAMGMQFRNGFAPGTVMLFLHPRRASFRYHMRNVRVPLELILVDRGRVCSLSTLTPGSGCSGLTSPHTAAIEAPVGWSKSHGLTVGQRIAWG